MSDLSSFNEWLIRALLLFSMIGFVACYDDDQQELKRITVNQDVRFCRRQETYHYHFLSLFIPLRMTRSKHSFLYDIKNSPVDVQKQFCGEAF